MPKASETPATEPAAETLDPSAIRMKSKTVFQNKLIQNGKDGVVLAGDEFTAPNIHWAKEARAVGLADPVDPTQLDGEAAAVPVIPQPIAPAPLSAPPPAAGPGRADPPAPATPGAATK